MSWIIPVQLAATLAEFLIAAIFFKDFLGVKYKSKLLWIISAVAFLAIYTFLNSYVDNFAIKLLITIMITFSLTFLFSGGIKLKMLAACLFFAFIYAGDAIVYYCLVLILKVDPNAVMRDNILGAIGLVISKLLILVIAKIVGSLRNKENTHLSLRYWGAVAIFPVFSVFILFVIFDISLKFNIAETSTTTLSVVSVIGILFFNILAFNLFEYFVEKYERDYRERVLKSQVAAQIKENDRLQYEFIAKRSFFHDLRHHTQLLHSLVKNGNAKEALSQISKMMELSDEKGAYVLTGNPAINALFNSHLGYAESQGIKIDVDNVHVPEGVDMDVSDICIIFANSIENAIEACLNVPKEERFIKIGLIYRDEKLVYKITNPTDGNVIPDKKGRFKSTKTSPGEHGIGLENIEKAVNRYGGVFDARHEDKIFTLGFSISFMKRQNYRKDKMDK